MVFVSLILTNCQKDDEDIYFDETLIVNGKRNINLKINIKNPENVYNTYQEALDRVREMKRTSGNGVSSLLVVENSSDFDAVMANTNVTHGYFYQAPPNIIPAGKFAAILGVKTSGTATGFEGIVSYKVAGESGDFFIHIGTSVPWWGSNGILAEVGRSVKPYKEFKFDFRDSVFSGKTDYSGRAFHISCEESKDIDLNAISTLVEDNSSILVNFKFSGSYYHPLGGKHIYCAGELAPFLGALYHLCTGYMAPD